MIETIQLWRPFFYPSDRMKTFRFVHSIEKHVPTGLDGLTVEIFKVGVVVIWDRLVFDTNYSLSNKIPQKF